MHRSLHLAHEYVAQHPECCYAYESIAEIIRWTMATEVKSAEQAAEFAAIFADARDIVRLFRERADLDLTFRAYGLSKKIVDASGG